MEDFANQFKQLESNPDARLAILSALIQNVSTKVLSKQLNDAQALKFFEEMLIAVMDPWSRIRKAAIDSVKNVLNSLSKHVDPLNLPPCSTEVCASDAGQGAAAPFREVRFPSFFDSLSQKYTNSTLWYEQEGLLRLSSALVTFWVKDAELSWKMTNLMGMPSLDVSALPVREAGAELLEEITSRRPECRISVRHELMQKLKTNGAENAAVDIVHSVEGCLIAFAKVCDKLVGSEQVEDEDEVAFLLKLGGHPAASIRLYVAEILRPPSEQLFGLVLEKMSRFANQEDLIEHWAFYEMIVITLNNHLMYYLEHRCISFSRCLAYMEHSEFWSIKEVSLRVIVSLLRGIDSSVFEMRRVATQVLPNFVQFHVRHVGSIYDMCDLYNRLKSSPGQVVLSKTRLCNLFDQHMLPLMWWYLAIYVTVRQSPLSRVEQEALARNLKRKLYINTLEEHPAAARIVFLIMCTYFPDICSKLIFGEMLKVESWDCILQRNGRKYIHFGIDFVRMMSIKGRNIAHLVPVWVNSLKHLMSHEQCIVLTMITDTLFPPRDAHLFSFAYDFTFKAPVMVDGGEDLTLGYNWLHSRYPTAEATPCAHDISSKSNMNENVDGYNEGTILAVKNIFDNLYASPGTEPAVLDKIRNLMELLLSDSRGRSWEETILEAIFARLHRLLPNWRDMSPLQEKVAESDDDWDASDDDNDGCVGTGAAEEKEHACVICKLVLSAVPSYHGKFASDVSILLDHGDIDS